MENADVAVIFCDACVQTLFSACLLSVLYI